jgi:photosystem II stability/assembly factor-like uncharacterized protein
MKLILSASLFLLSTTVFAQWEPLEIPKTTRYDDVFFIDATTGWAVGGGARTIYKTTDGGVTWTLKFQSDIAPDYLRSIEFVDAQTGYVGSLNERLYRTNDGGETWTEISNDVPFSITYLGQVKNHLPGICGLSTPTTNVVYGCGIWNNGPAYVIKSTNGGTTWTTIDMTQYATQLVDIFFLNENEGFVTGRANPRTDGGIVLYTSDGGANWQVVHKTMTANDYIWKIQTPDSVNYFGSIQSEPFTENVRFIKSTNSGFTWNTLPVTNEKWNYIQMIGFKDALNGWTGGTANGSGGETALFETNDGGETWTRISYGCAGTFNRFFKIDDQNIFMTGQQVYKYNPSYESDCPNIEFGPHNIVSYPNPSNGNLTLELLIESTTRCTLEIVDINGKSIQLLHNGFINSGQHAFPVRIGDAGVYFAVLHTNEGINYTKIRVK